MIATYNKPIKLTYQTYHKFGDQNLPINFTYIISKSFFKLKIT